MDLPIPYKGTRWYKCDLHLHTTASKCFQDRNVTPQQWVSRVIEQGLDCVAVTDHNTGNLIDEIKAAAAGTSLTIFPGVEITCDTAKVHLLIIFDVSKGTDDINDFLIRCGINREMFADQAAGTTKGIFEIAQLANENGAIVIPAHIDEYNGLGSVSFDNLKLFFDLPYINAVQVVHKDFMDPSLQANNNEALRSSLNDYYNNPSPPIDYGKILDWQRPVKLALLQKLAITTFSDNPHEPKNSKHGLAGIGSRFTWIKMDENPTLEGLRQAFLLPEFRVKSDFISQLNPYHKPELWIKSIAVSRTQLNDGNLPLIVEFSPQLTTIIGGRGSGKSSILRFIRGLFNRIIDLQELHEIIADHADFYKRFDPRNKKGVLTENSILDIEFVRNNVLHKISASWSNSSSSQITTIQKFDAQSGTWNLEPAEGYLDFFQFEQYSQKQIYEIAQEPNSLRERIDKAIPRVEVIKSEREIIKRVFLEKSASIRTIQQQVSGKGRLQTEISDLDERIRLLLQSGIASLLISKETFANQQQVISSFTQNAKNKEESISILANSIEFEDTDFTFFPIEHSDQIAPLSKALMDGYAVIKADLQSIKERAEKLRTNFETAIESSAWKAQLNANQTDFEVKKQELADQGIEDISNFERLTLLRDAKNRDLERIIEIEATLTHEVSERSRLQTEYLENSKAITTERKAFVASLMQDDKVKVSINPFRNKTDFVNKLRLIIQRPGSFEADVDTLTDMCFSGNAERGISNVRETFLKIRRGDTVPRISGFFNNLVNGMTDAQIDEIELFLPEDEIDIKYKPSGATSFKPLSTASAGQKTTAILTFILSHGDIPLLLDQPEDDLDNRLVYELIVDRLRQAKEHRQIIVVTHNANIPVNADAEYIISMNSESVKLSIFCSGTVEQPNVKKEICDVMEGSEQAFDMRSKRYKHIPM